MYGRFEGGEQSAEKNIFIVTKQETRTQKLQKYTMLCLFIVNIEVRLFRRKVKPYSWLRESVTKICMCYARGVDRYI